MSWTLVYSKHAQKDVKKNSAAGLKKQTQKLLDLLTLNPFKTPPSYEKLVGDLTGVYSRRINIQHRLVYESLKKEKTVRILRMWSHYE